MRRLGLLVIPLMLFAGCGIGKYHGPASGTIVVKHFVPAHDETYSYQQCYSYDLKTFQCTFSVWQQGANHYNDWWGLTIQRCETKCKYGTFGVSNQTYNEHNVGEFVVKDRITS